MQSTVVMSTVIDHWNSSEYSVKPFPYYSNENTYAETLKEVLVNEAAILFQKMVKDFANQNITDTAAGSVTKLLPSIIYSNVANLLANTTGL